MTWNELAVAIAGMSPEERMQEVDATFPDNGWEGEGRDYGAVTGVKWDEGGDKLPYLYISNGVI